MANQVEVALPPAQVEAGGRAVAPTQGGGQVEVFRAALSRLTVDHACGEAGAQRPGYFKSLSDCTPTTSTGTARPTSTWIVHPVVAHALPGLYAELVVYDINNDQQQLQRQQNGSSSSGSSSHIVARTTHPTYHLTTSTTTVTGNATPTSAAAAAAPAEAVATRISCVGVAAIPALALGAIARDYGFIRDAVVRYAHVHRGSAPPPPTLTLQLSN